MDTDPRVSELLLRWQELRREGRAVTPAEQCADCPQLAGELASGANQAYSDATAQATGNKSLIMVAIAAVALVAVVMLKKH